MKILVTGSNGYIASRLIDILCNKKYDVIGVSRKKINTSIEFNNIVKDITDKSDWNKVLSGINCVIHTAGIVHKRRHNSSIDEYRKVNVDGTINLAKNAAKAGVERFIFLSSIKVNGEYNSSSKPFEYNDSPNPVSDYAISKYEAEKGLIEIGENTSMDIVIIRPPLVYGENVKANFNLLIKIIRTGLPLPFKNINNIKSFIYIDNLIDIICKIIENKEKINKILLVSDNENISIKDLIIRIAAALNIKVVLFSMNKKIVKWFLKIINLEYIYNKIYNNLYVNIDDTIKILNWKPKKNMEQNIITMLKKMEKNDEKII